MYKNYFFLKRFLCEADKELAGSAVISAFSQEKDKIIFQFSSGNYESGSKFLEISSNPGTPYLALKKYYARAKKNTLDFFTEYFPSKLISAEIAEYDRVIRFNFEKASVYFMVRGKFTNVILISDSQKIIPFKKTDHDFLNSFLVEIKKISFILPFSENHFDL